MADVIDSKKVYYFQCIFSKTLFDISFNFQSFCVNVFWSVEIWCFIYFPGFDEETRSLQSTTQTSAAPPTRKRPGWELKLAFDQMLFDGLDKGYTPYNFGFISPFPLYVLMVQTNRNHHCQRREIGQLIISIKSMVVPTLSFAEPIPAIQMRFCLVSHLYWQVKSYISLWLLLLKCA